MNDYNFSEHVHRYACWAAARAASVSRFSNAQIARFIEAAHLREELKLLASLENLSPLIYKAAFIMQVNGILHSMEVLTNKNDGQKLRNFSFGSAAQVVSTYTMAAEIIPSGGTSRISQVAFPVIDCCLLNGLQKKLNIQNRTGSSMDEVEYIELIEKLQLLVGSMPFWKLEKYRDLN